MKRLFPFDFSETVALLCVEMGIVLFFSFALPHFRIDRTSENLYLQIPYSRIVVHDVHVWDSDPFVENSPLLVYTLAGMTVRTGGLVAQRYAQFAFTLLNIGLIFLLLKRFVNLEGWPPYTRLILALIVFLTWLVTPKMRTYAVQTNGMTAGVSCLLAGLLLLENHPFGAMLAFGTAYQFKGQFLAMYPAMIAYWLLLERPHSSPRRHVLRVLGLAATFFVPPMIISPLVLAALGWFRSTTDFFHYALWGPQIISNEAVRFFHQVFRHAGTPARTVGIRASEYQGYGLLARGLIVISMGTCALWTAQGIYQRFGGALSRRLPVAFSFFGVIGLFYWCHFLFFWDYPYWYNVFPVVWMNIFIIPFWCYRAGEFFRTRLTPVGFRRLFALGCALACWAVVAAVGVRWRKLHNRSGDALTPYDWMKSG